MKLQIADEEQQQEEVSKLLERLDEAGRLAEQRERTARRLEGDLRDFVRQHEKELLVTNNN